MPIKELSSWIRRKFCSRGFNIVKLYIKRECDRIKYKKLPCFLSLIYDEPVERCTDYDACVEYIACLENTCKYIYSKD